MDACSKVAFTVYLDAGVGSSPFQNQDRRSNPARVGEKENETIEANNSLTISSSAKTLPGCRYIAARLLRTTAVTSPRTRPGLFSVNTGKAKLSSGTV